MYRKLSALLFSAVLLVAGCSTTSKVEDDAPMAADSGRVYTNAVHVLVDGDDVGTVPRTVHVRRGFGTRTVSLWKAGEEFRTYEIEFVSTVAGEQMRSGFWSSESIEGETYDARVLPNDGKGTYFVPYAQYPIKVEDHDYGLTLLVQD